MNIAVLGMGRMGRALAGRLLAGGHQVTVWNRSTGKAREIVSAGAREAQSVAAAVDGADVVITMLADDAAIRAVAFGELRSSIGARTTYIDCSTVSRRLSGELAEVLSARFLAMPVVGGPAAVSAGQATFLVGRDAGVVDRLSAVISSLTGNVRRYDAAPLAVTAKLATNLLLLSGVVALAESIAVGRSGGLRDDQLRELLATSPLMAPGLKKRFEGVLTGSQDGWWTTVLGAKGADLALDIARDADLALPTATVARHLYENAASSGLECVDIAAVTDLYRSPLRTTATQGR
ncbi:NAD(P)-dependent oxidoreductase [Rhodococcus wratislaviensis]|uniref:Putative dehydrogenase n=1 Tax=Rhodococcus wratislaviensis NBRC 100605 TaxID=1219028 RepID=X0PYF0_RHOWR|nr:NAD(P)-dependent oxidoreductase [Rhodococcus wratislaviensis]GAF48594.1 putative dehydrogenase [Rhodococcus wratislaviensis NBRC 100605]